MDIAGFNAVCGAFPGAERVVQWGGLHVWKVGGKIFAIAEPRGASSVCPSFKANEIVRPILLDRPGMAPAPYLARAGWVALTRARALSDGDLRIYLEQAHSSVASKLPRHIRVGLGIAVPPAARTAGVKQPEK